jgi:hypothetical protein
MTEKGGVVMRLPLGPQLKNIEQEAELEFRESIQNQMDEERRLREESDEKEHKFTLKWNRINLTVALIGVLFGIAGFVVGLLALLATH